jgi:hypothetical protein
LYLTKSFIHPDEYWQGTEIAYHMVYGGVNVPWEWNASFRIRSYLYPMYLALPLRIMDFLSIDNAFTVRAGYYLA